MPRGVPGRADRASVPEGQRPGRFQCSARPLRKQTRADSPRDTYAEHPALTSTRKAVRKSTELRAQADPQSARIRYGRPEGRDACGRILMEVLPSGGDASGAIARTRPPSAATPPPAPPRRNTRYELQTTAAFRIAVSGTQLRHPGAVAVDDLHPDNAVPGPDRDRLPGYPRRAEPQAVAEQLAPEQRGVSSARGAPEPVIRL